MPANVKTVIYIRQALWHGLEVSVDQTLSSKEALEKISAQLESNTEINIY